MAFSWPSSLYTEAIIYLTAALVVKPDRPLCTVIWGQQCAGFVYHYSAVCAEVRVKANSIKCIHSSGALDGDMLAHSVHKSTRIFQDFWQTMVISLVA